MTAKEKRLAAPDLIYLAGCAVKEEKPEMARVEKMDPESVHELASSLSLNAAVFTALSDAYDKKLPDTQLYQAWREESDFALYKEMKMDQERRALFSWMEEQGIWHMSLKGILLKELYPQKGMRQMSDNDILFDESGRKLVHSWFLERGYKAEYYRQESHDAYLKKPFYNFEMHSSLFYFSADTLFQDYYRDIKSRLLPVPGKAYEYRFGEEDFYVYMTAHNCKHYRNGGIGLRAILDVFVYLRETGETLDWDRISRATKRLKITDYETTVRNLAEKLFRDPPQFSFDQLSYEERAVLDAHITLGTYGTMENQVRNRLRTIKKEEGGSKRSVKVRYFLRRAFPEPAFFQAYYPFFYRHRYLLPFGYIYRLVYKGITNRKRLLAETRSLRKL